MWTRFAPVLAEIFTQCDAQYRTEMPVASRYGGPAAPIPPPACFSSIHAPRYPSRSQSCPFDVSPPPKGHAFPFDAERTLPPSFTSLSNFSSSPPYKLPSALPSVPPFSISTSSPQHSRLTFTSPLRHTPKNISAMAFVSAFTPALARPALSGAAVCKAAPSAARVSMADKSPSVPFMEVPDALSSDMPGYVGFGTSSTSTHRRRAFPPRTRPTPVTHCSDLAPRP